MRYKLLNAHSILIKVFPPLGHFISITACLKLITQYLLLILIIQPIMYARQFNCQKCRAKGNNTYQIAWDAKDGHSFMVTGTALTFLLAEI